MDRRQVHHRPPKSRDLGDRDQTVSAADDRGFVQPSSVESDDLLRTPASGTGARYQVLGICALLLLAVGAVFGQTVGHDFVNFDDRVDVSMNERVTVGLTAAGVKWAFTHCHSNTWAPLLWISHMLDCQFYGVNAGGHHLTNVLLHAATAVLLFLVLRQMTGRLWPSALAAALFALHPLRVESVAWITERKDVLSGLFFVLTLAAYVGYVRRPFSLVRYLTVVVCFALGLMAKPMLVTLPMVLLLLDYWPLGRMAGATGGNRDSCGDGMLSPRSLAIFARLVLEKLPLLALSASSCVMAALAEETRTKLAADYFTLLWRIGNALVSYVVYLGEFFYPVGLAFPQPCPEHVLLPWKMLGALLLLVAITAATVVCRRRRPYLLVGWLWYLGMMVPVIGLVEFGFQSMSDRFTYLPQIGLCIALAWGAADVSRSWSYRRSVCSIAAALMLAAMMACAWRQTSYWRDSETLLKRALACTSRNYMAHYGLGTAYLDARRIDDAVAEYRSAIAIYPKYALAHFNLGAALDSLGRSDEAMTHYEEAAKIKPDDPAAQNNFGNALLMHGRIDEAMAHCREALKIDSDFAEAHYNLGNALFVRGELDEAMAEYRKAVDAKPNYPEAFYNMGMALAGRKRFDEAIAQYQQALKINPDFAEVHNSLGLALIALGRSDEAVTHYRKALKIRPDFIEAHNNLAKALAHQSRVE